MKIYCVIKYNMDLREHFVIKAFTNEAKANDFKSKLFNTNEYVMAHISETELEE